MIKGQGSLFFFKSLEKKNRSPCQYLQSSGGHDSVGVWAEALAAPPGRISAGWQHHWGGSHLLPSLYLPRNSASPWGRPAVGCGLAHGTTPPHGGLKVGRNSRKETETWCVWAGRRCGGDKDWEGQEGGVVVVWGGGHAEWKERRECSAKCFEINYWPIYFILVSTFSGWHHFFFRINHDLMSIHWQQR